MKKKVFRERYNEFVDISEETAKVEKIEEIEKIEEKKVTKRGRKKSVKSDK